MQYTCVRCGKQFEAKHKTAVCQDCHTAVCVVCGKEFKLQHPWTQKTCSSECRGIYRKQSGIGKQVAAKASETRKIKYGTSNLREVQRSNTYTKTCKFCGKEFTTNDPRREYCYDTHYGQCPVCGKQVEIKDMSIGPQACSDECRVKRIAATCEDKYGDRVVMNSKYGREKSKRTCLEKYGVDHYSKSEEYRQKFTETSIKHYGVPYPTQSDVVLSKISDTCKERYGVPFHCMTPECRNSYRTISKVNMEFADMLDAQGISYEMEFPIGRYSYDFKIGDYLIEVDPTITHNSYLSIFPGSDPTDSQYHMKKTENAAIHGFHCIHIYDWDSWDSILMLLCSKTNVYARNTRVVKLDKAAADSFTEANHIQGKCRGQVENYGLMLESQLVQVMTFGKPRYNSNYDYELLRLCSLPDIRVIGGASKLFSQFVKDNDDASVISYCDRSKFRGDVYTRIGMTLLRQSPPAKIWSKDSRKITDNLLRQRGYDQLFNADYGKGTDNETLMIHDGWLPVYDCGQLVYEFRRT